MFIIPLKSSYSTVVVDDNKYFAKEEMGKSTKRWVSPST
jgi:hypothetical protein